MDLCTFLHMLRVPSTRFQSCRTVSCPCCWGLPSYCHRIGVSFHGCVALLAPCAILRCPRPLHAPSFPALLLMHSPAVAPLRLHYHLCSVHLATRTCVVGLCMGNGGHPARLPDCPCLSLSCSCCAPRDPMGSTCNGKQRCLCCACPRAC